MGKDRIVLEKDAEGYYTKKCRALLPDSIIMTGMWMECRFATPLLPFCYGCFGAKNFFELPEPGQISGLSKMFLMEMCSCISM